MLRRTALRQFSSLSRSQFRYQKNFPHHVPNNTPVKFYKVRFARPPFFTRQRARKVFVYGVTLAAVWHYILPEFITISFEEVEEEVVGEDGQPDVQTEEGEEEVEDGFFIPFGWPQKQPRTFYRASDPEWKEFIKFAKDQKRHKDIQLRLVSAIRSEIAGLPNSKRLLGDVNTSKGRYWLEITFPDGPPQDYEVSGIEITDEFIAWSIKTVSQKDYQRLYRTMVPTAAMKASWASFRYHLNTQANKVREYLGLQPVIDPEVALIKASLKEKPDTRQFGRSPPSPPSPPPPPGIATPPKVPDGSFTPITPPAPPKVEATDAEDTKIGLPKLPSVVPQGESKPVTLALFLHNLNKNRGAMTIEPPRGSVVVTGLIEVIGSKGRTTLDVSAAFDPSSNEYLLWNWRPRRMQPKHQRPKGGP